MSGTMWAAGQWAARAEIDDLRAAVAVLLEQHAAAAVVRVRHARPAADHAAARTARDSLTSVRVHS